MKKLKIRRDFKITKIVVLCIIILFSIIVLFNAVSRNKAAENSSSVGNYNNNFSYEFKIDTKDNDFVDYSNDVDYTAYVTNLIENIKFDFKYKFEEMSNKNSNLKYTYDVSGKLLGYYNKNGEEQKIIEKNYEIVPKKENSLRGRNITIDEKFNVDVKPLNDLINNFKLQQDMLITSNYQITMNIEIEGATNEKIQYSPSILVEIGNKTTKITGENNIVKYVGDNIDVIPESQSNSFIIILFACVIVVAILRLLYLIFFTEELVVIKNMYKAEINEIVRGYQDKVVLVNNLPKFTRKTIIEVENMEEIAKLSEELFKPILCYENEDQTVTQFIVMSDETVYKFVINKK